MNARREWFVAGSPDDLAREAARRFIELAGAAIRDRGRFAVALSGGSTPRRLYELLTLPPYRQAVDWSRVHLFFADERFVPPMDSESTARLVRETLLNDMPIPAENFHPMPTEDDPPETCAARYAETLARFFGAPGPELDLVLLGMGPDGHTASLFPGHPDHPGQVAAVHDSPKPPPVRLTLTLEALRRARKVLFLVTGADKADTLKSVYDANAPPDAVDTLPAARVTAVDGSSEWLIDRAAAACLPDTVTA